MCSGQFTQIVFLTIYLWICTSAQNCPNGWFGSQCQFQCHCRDHLECDSGTGQCRYNSACATGWFGNGCQFRTLTEDFHNDYSSNILTIPTQSWYSWITDRDDSTCNTDVSLESIEVYWYNISVPFTWLRITLSDGALLGSLNITFSRPTAANAVCPGQEMYIVNSNTADFRCKVVEEVTSVIIGGRAVKSLCSLYISGGRNFALKQDAFLTTPSLTYSASKIVDGNVDGGFGACSHSDDLYTRRIWNVTFTNSQVVNQVLLFMRSDPECFSGTCTSHINTLTVQIFNSTEIVFENQDQLYIKSPVYIVNVEGEKSTIPVNGLSITFNTTYYLNISLCEVEAYGECVPGSWGLECNNSCSTSCGSQCHVETGSCLLCNGFKDPPHCNTVCATGTWGINCTNNCNSSCWENSCNNVEGSCDRGCNGFKDFPTCNKECDFLHWGPNCTRTCNMGCFNLSCDSISGACNEGCYGYSNPPICNTACDKGKWGLNCTKTCNTSCWDNSCNRFTGLCDEGCNGFKNFPHCSLECDSMTWGLNCTSACRSSCFNSSCDRLSGICNQGCDGYSDPPMCTQECYKGKWGRECSNTCNASCWNNSCNHVTGMCDAGCNGYKDYPKCISACDDGLWGLNCAQSCKANCYNKTCDKQTEVCNQGCNGYRNRPNCDAVCSPGSWGLDCAMSCQENCYDRSCDPQTGLCNTGCNGYRNYPFCNIACEQRSWGFNCVNRCKDSCYDSSCDKVTGLCNRGCIGFRNFPSCDVECLQGMSGVNCTTPCDHCFHNSCDHINGKCTIACEVGYSVFPDCSANCPERYYGVDCSLQCSQNCQDGHCNSTTGICLHCPQGYQGQLCDVEDKDANSSSMLTGLGAGLGVSCAVIISLLIVIIVFMRRGRHVSTNKRTDDHYDSVTTGNDYSHEYQTHESPSHYQNVPTRNRTAEQTNVQMHHVYNNEDAIANNEYETIGI